MSAVEPLWATVAYGHDGLLANRLLTWPLAVAQLTLKATSVYVVPW